MGYNILKFDGTLFLTLDDTQITALSTDISDYSIDRNENALHFFLKDALTVTTLFSDIISQPFSINLTNNLNRCVDLLQYNK